MGQGCASETRFEAVGASCMEIRVRDYLVFRLASSEISVADFANEFGTMADGRPSC